MSESSLTLNWLQIQAEVGFFLGYGRTLANWDTAQDAEVAAIIQAGVRRVFYPPDSGGWEWSFLRPTATLYLGASGTDGVLSSGTFNSATFTDWTAQGITTADKVYITAPTVSIETYDITSVAAGAITLTETPDDAIDLTFVVKRSPANYDLPDNFSRLIGDLHFAAAEYQTAITIVSLGNIEEMRARSDQTGTPCFAAIRYKSSVGSTGQRQEILFWPEPSVYFPLTFAYEVYSGVLSDTYPYPLGGMHLSELYLESCLAVAEQRINGEAGLHTQMYQALLSDAIARDRKRGPRFYGHIGRGEDDDGETFRRGRDRAEDGAYSVIYKGEQL